MKKLIPFAVRITWLHGIHHGWGNGYVALPEGHKYFGVGYDDIPVDVHGGPTFAELNDGSNPRFPAETKGMWVVGFDTAHYNDSLERWPDEESVMVEANNLLKQLSV